MMRMNMSHQMVKKVASVMNPLCLSMALVAIAGHQGLCAEDAEKIQNLQGEINVVQQAASDQGEKIRALEKRVDSRESSLAKSQSPSPGGEKYTDDGQVPDNSGRVKDGPNHSYRD